VQTDTAGLADPSRPETDADESEAGKGKLARGIARGALIVAVFTAFSRVLGFVSNLRVA
jgi:hypothetical protein